MNSLPSKWICRNNNKADRELLKKTGHSGLLLELLAKRDIATEKDIGLFLNPSLGNLHNPMKLPGIKIGIKRVKEAVEKKEKILIFGDYDADGVISASLMYKFLKDLGLEVDVYIPDRFNEGYDLSINFFKKISNENKYNLIISVDCGTNSIKVQEFVRDNEKAPDVVVCDHHNQTVELDTESHRYIVINPGLKNSVYPFRYLSGAAVTFKFITGILREMDDKWKKKFEKGYLTEMLDLVAISTIADMMPLIDENRIIVKRGLTVLKKTVNPGLEKMISTLMLDRKYLDENDIGFIIAPRLNASGRIKNARSSFELLTEDGDIVDRIVNELNYFNEKRQKIQKSIFDEIVENNDFDKIVAEKRIFIGRSKNWNEGVLGIVASNIVKEFNIPAILFKETKGKLKGSGRSIDKFDLHGNLVLCSNLFESFGGHRLACGITMDVSNYEIFYDNFMKIAGEKLKIHDVKKRFIYDVEINFNDITTKIIREINLLKPFGCGNPEPRFVTTNCIVNEFLFLSDGKHVRLKLNQCGITMDAIMFGVNDRARNKIINNKKISILYKIKENNRGNFSTVQLVILDLF